VRDGLPESAALRVPPGARMQTPLCRLAQEVAELAGWRRYGLAFLLGVLLAGALPPIDLTPLIFVAFAGLLWLDEGSRGIWASARLGYVFGFGFFLAGMYWIAAALFVDISSFWWALPFAVLGLPACSRCGRRRRCWSRPSAAGGYGSRRTRGSAFRGGLERY